MYRTSLTSDYGLLFKKYVKTIVEDEDERTVQLKHMRYHETISGEVQYKKHGRVAVRQRSSHSNHGRDHTVAS